MKASLNIFKDESVARLVSDGSLSITNKHRPSPFPPAFVKVRVKCSCVNVTQHLPVICLYGTLKMTPLPYAVAMITCKRHPPANSLHPLAVR